MLRWLPLLLALGVSAQRRPLQEFTINLDLDPSMRFVEVTTHFNESIQVPKL